MNDRGQIAAAVIAGVAAALLGAVLLLYLARIAVEGGHAQTAADMTAIGAARVFGADPSAPVAEIRRAAETAATANGARLVSIRIERTGAVPVAVDVAVAVEVDGSVPIAGAQQAQVLDRARAGVSYSAAVSAAAFRPIDLGGARGPLAAVAAAEAQVGWPYVWGGESRAEGGFDCSGLIDFAYAAAGLPLPGRPTAADLWRMARPEPAAALVPGDLVFLGTGSGAPYHVGMYVGGGDVVVAPHTGAAVRYEPLAAGGWDGFGRLAGPAPTPVVADPAVESAARRFQVPPHVLAAELALGVERDPAAAAARLAAAQRRHHGDIAAALADALGDPSLAAVALRRASGPALGDRFRATIRLLPAAESGPPSVALPAPPGVAATPPGRPAGGAGGGSISGPASQVVGAAERVADHLEQTGGRATFQGAAGLKTLGRAGLTLLSSVLPRQWERDAAAAAGSAWDGASAVSDFAAGGLPLETFGLWASRVTVIGSLICLGTSLMAVRRARDAETRVFAATQAAGYGLTAAGVLTAGDSLLGLGAASAEIPPVGLVLCAAGAGLLVASYGYRYRGALGRALDLARQAPTAPARYGIRAAGAVLDAGRSAWDAVNPF